MVTRGQYALFIARAFDLPMPKNPKRFKDVTDKVSTSEGIVKAYEAGIVQGYLDERFRPNEEITRAQMAIMLDRALQSKDSYPEKATLTYVDRGSIGKSSYEAVQRLTHYGIMEGFNSGTYFEPHYPVGRLLTVLSIYSLLEETNLLDDTAMKKIKAPQGWTEAVIKEHDKKIADTVLKYSPKIGAGLTFGIISYTWWNFEDPTFLSSVEKGLTMYGSKMIIVDWLAAVNHVIKTGDIWIIHMGFTQST